MLHRVHVLVFAGTVAAILGCGGSADTNLPSQDSTALAAEATRQQCGTFSFGIPHGWSIVSPDRSKTKAMLLLDGRDWQTARAMIKIDVGTPAFPSAEELASNFATSAGGQVAPETLDFDGVKATKATTSSTNMAIPREIIVIYHNGEAYLVMAGAVSGVDLTDAMEHLRSTWKWEG